MRYHNPETGALLDASEEDYANRFQAEGFVPVDAEPAEESPPVEAPNLDQMTRDELNAHAASLGISDPASYPNKAALVQAIEGQTAPVLDPTES